MSVGLCEALRVAIRVLRESRSSLRCAAARRLESELDTRRRCNRNWRAKVKLCQGAPQGNAETGEEL